MNVIPAKKFVVEAGKFLKKNPRYRVKLEKTLYLLKIDCKHPSLRLHKLSGNENYSISIDLSIRIILHFEGENIFLLRIGRHEEVY